MSKRAELLKRVLKYIDHDDFEDFGDHIEFGSKSKLRRDVAAMQQNAGEPHFAPDDLGFLDEASDVLRRFAGLRLSQERTSLEPGRPGIEDLLKRLDGVAAAHPECKFAHGYVQGFRDMWTNSGPAHSTHEPSGHEPPGLLTEVQVDFLDQRYAEEMLGKLETVVSRASRLQRLELKTIPRRSVELHFQQAHRCYLYGFNLACAVLCRAMLESALKGTIDPNGKLRPKELGESHMLAMIRVARIRGRLPDPLAEWAKQVKDAGDKAAHNAEAFEKEYSQRLQNILCKARKVLESLYGASVGRIAPDACS